jgi:hypothetical protein
MSMDMVSTLSPRGCDPTNKYLECAYIIRYIEFTNRPEKSPWSLRQFAVYHKFIHSESTRCSTWLLIGASQRTESSFNEYVEHVSDVNRAHPFELHVIFLNTAISSWRAYLIYLLEQVAQVVSTSCQAFSVHLT